MKHIVVTGGAGLIGSFLCKKLLKDGHAVICIDNFITGSREAITEGLDNKNFRLIEKDVTLTQEYDVKHIDWVFHLASPASPNYNSPISYHALPMETMMVNTVGTHNMLKLAEKHKARFVFASTSEVYGDPLEHPQKESYYGNVSPTGPRSIYDEAKRFGETLTAHYVRKRALDGRIARIFNTYGPGMRKEDKRMIINFILQALNGEALTIYGNGTQTRSLCYVVDTCEGLYQLMAKDDIAGEVINIGSQDEHTVKEYAELVLQITGSPSTITYNKAVKNDPQRRRPNIAKAKKLLGWTPITSLRDGLKKTIEHYQLALNT